MSGQVQKRRTNRIFKSLHKPLTYLGVERTLFYFVCVGAVGAFNIFNSILAGLAVFIGGLPNEASGYEWKRETGDIQSYQHNQTDGWLHIDQQSQFYDRHAQPVAKEHALEHAGHLTLAVSEISQAQSIAKGGVGTDQGLTRLIDEVDLYDRLQELLSSPASVDIAMAWIRCGRPLDAILGFAKSNPGKLRVLCGVNGFLTEPAALFQIQEVACLKIAYGTSGRKLDSKLFLFRAASATTVWVGSANLTESAFSVNRELVCETVDDGSAVGIFDAYWKEFNTPDADWLRKYAALCGQLPTSPSIGLPNLGAPQHRPPGSEDWKTYVARLRARNWERLDWIAGQLPEVTQIGLSNWQQLSKTDAEKLLGIAKIYGALGRLQGAGVVKNIFYEPSWKNLLTREKIEAALNVIPPNPSAPAFEPMIKRAFDLITSLDRVNVATVSRLLAVRHPDRFVSVNKASTAGLSLLSGISQTDLHSSAGYVALIRWVMNQPWWSAPDPQDETSIYWRQRAALLDILAYSGDPSKGTQSESDYDVDDE